MRPYKNFAKSLVVRERELNCKKEDCQEAYRQIALDKLFNSMYLSNP